MGQTIVAHPGFLHTLKGRLPIDYLPDILVLIFITFMFSKQEPLLRCSFIISSAHGYNNEWVINNNNNNNLITLRSHEYGINEEYTDI